MCSAAPRIVLTALLVSWAAAQDFQVLGTTVVDQDFFVKGELMPGETLALFIRRYRKKHGLSPKTSPRVDGVTVTRPTLATSSEPLGLSAGAKQVLRSVDDSFSCEGLPYGYYSDPSNACHVYHVCYPMSLPSVSRQAPSVRMMLSASFFCNVNQVFDQHLLTCVPDTPSFDCEGVRRLYGSSNSQFFGEVDFNESTGAISPLADSDGRLPDSVVDLGTGQTAADADLPEGERLQFVDLVKRSLALISGLKVVAISVDPASVNSH
ncbi:uncharacterized protein LOC119089868 [Pollicipes pollicipes]|uniref:uncharacterized protein LOC119089868 n=1 Tax=Pollicipes pollicipes TaxID=41117 RepID=UPI001884DBAD|nr:uncharacterized protein LOC119089868 [Pollicipes pollicipes]